MQARHRDRIPRLGLSCRVLPTTSTVPVLGVGILGRGGAGFRCTSITPVPVVRDLVAGGAVFPRLHPMGRSQTGVSNLWL